VLEMLAADARLREHFLSNEFGQPMRIEDEVRFLRGCAERFDVYSRMLRSAGGDEPSEEASTLFVPAVRSNQAIVPAGPSGLTVAPGATEAAPAREEQVGGGSLFGGAVSARGELLAAYERLLLFASLELDLLREDLTSTVIDQDEAVATLLDDFSLYAVGTQNLTRPGSYFLVGPTGVGKNYLVETLVAVLERQWGIEVPLLTIEGPNYTYSSDINELRGATRGFIRSDEPGLLTSFHERSSAAPLSVIIVDEVEKAHPQLRRFFLSIMDRGSTTDAHGNELNFAGTLIFFTSNIGHVEGDSGRPIGFGGEDEAASVYRAELTASLKRVLSPEFINRLKILKFRHLPRESATRILELEFEKIARRYQELHGIEIVLSEAGREALLDEGYSHEYGARHLAAVLQRICNVGVGKMIRRDEEREPRDAGDLLARVRELRESDADVDLSRLDREIVEKARAKVPYKKIVVDAEGRPERRIVYRRDS
ncbi:MAG: AAA family ATPase, partial [Acidobacteriota bacterium]|nr:AAA family ATPase [Acidobacteriota bacterium]